MQDDRFNLPSASGIERLALCPGSWALEQTVPPEPESDDAASGTRIHAALAEFANQNREPEPGTLSDRETETFEMCAEVYDRVVMAWINPYAPTPPTSQKTEQREWLLDANFERVFSGQYDALIIDGARALCIDYKTGHGEQTDSVSNLQLRALAVLIMQNYDITEVTVAIIQPWVSMKPQLCRYDMSTYRQALAEIVGIIRRTAEPSAPRVPGDQQCKFCRARAVCPEANRTVSTLATLHTREIEPVDLLRMLELIGPAKKVIASLEARAKRLLEENPDSLPGWTLESGNERRKITNAQAAFDALMQACGNDAARAAFRDAFISKCVTVKVSELETEFRKTNSLKTQPARGIFNGALEASGALDKKENKPSLTRASVALEIV